MEMSLKRVLVCILISTGITGCGALPIEQLSHQVSNIHIDSIGHDGERAFCESFKPNRAQVAAFFKNARVIDAATLHHEYDYLPCYVKGTLKFVDQSEKRCDFSLRAGGTAELVCEGERSYIFACDVCSDPFSR